MVDFFFFFFFFLFLLLFLFVLGFFFVCFVLFFCFLFSQGWKGQTKNKINHLSIVSSGVSSVSGLGWGGGQERLKLPDPHSEILWFPSPRGGRRVCGTAGDTVMANPS